MYYYKILVKKVGTPTVPFTLSVDGVDIVKISPENIGENGVIITFASYRPSRFFGFPQSTHTLKTGFMDTPANYSIMDLYPSRKWLSYTPHTDSAGYDVTLLDYAFYQTFVEVAPAS